MGWWEWNYWLPTGRQEYVWKDGSGWTEVMHKAGVCHIVLAMVLWMSLIFFFFFLPRYFMYLGNPFWKCNKASTNAGSRCKQIISRAGSWNCWFHISLCVFVSTAGFSEMMMVWFCIKQGTGNTKYSIKVSFICCSEGALWTPCVLQHLIMWE